MWTMPVCRSCLSLVIFALLVLGSAPMAEAQAPPDSARIYLPFAWLGDQPRLEIESQIGGVSEAMVLLGGLTYIGAGPRVLVYEHSNVEEGRLTLVGQSPVLPGIVYDLATDERYPDRLVAALGVDGLALIGLSDPVSPALLGSMRSVGDIDKVAAHAGYVYGLSKPVEPWRASKQPPLRTFDMRIPTRIRQLAGTIDPVARASLVGVLIYSGHLLIAELLQPEDGAGASHIKLNSYVLREGDLPAAEPSVDVFSGYNYAPEDVSLYFDQDRLSLLFTGPVFVGQRQYFGWHLAGIDLRQPELPRRLYAGRCGIAYCHDIATHAVDFDGRVFVGCREGLRQLDYGQAGDVAPKQEWSLDLHGTISVLRDELFHLALLDGGYAVVAQGNDQMAPSILASVLGPGRLHALAASGDRAYVAGRGLNEIMGLSEGNLQMGPALALDVLTLAADEGHLVTVTADELRVFDLDPEGSLRLQSRVALPEAEGRRVRLHDGWVYVADTTASLFPGVGTLRLHRGRIDRLQEPGALESRYAMPEPSLRFTPTGIDVAGDMLYVTGIRDLDGQFEAGLYRMPVEGFEPGAEVEIEQFASLSPYQLRRLVLHQGSAYMPSETGLERFDLAEPSNHMAIRLPGKVPATALIAVGDELVASGTDGSLHVIDVGGYRQALPMPAGRVPGRPVDLAVSAGRLWVATAEGGLYGLIDTSCRNRDRDNPRCAEIGGRSGRPVAETDPVASRMRGSPGALAVGHDLPRRTRADRRSSPAVEEGLR